MTPPHRAFSGPRVPRITRALAIAHVQRKLHAHGFPRAQMFLIVALTGAFAWLASYGLLRGGLDPMVLRYPLAVVLAYGFFLLLIWLWLRTNARDYTDFPQVDGPGPDAFGGSPGGSAAPEVHAGGGGDFAGGGASGSFDAPVATLADLPGASPHTATDLLSSPVDALGAAAEADELAVPLVAIVLAVGMAFASFYVVYIAPALFAELAIDAALSYALIRHLRADERGHWFTTAFRHTGWPFVGTVLLLAAVGAGLGWMTPGARTLGEALHPARVGQPSTL